MKRNKKASVPNVLQAKFDSIGLWLEAGIHLENRLIYINGDINENRVGLYIRALAAMAELDQAKPVDLLISTYGGEVYESFGLYDYIRNCPFLVRTHASGKVMSAGVTIFLAGDERYSQDKSTFMIHSVSSGTSGKLYNQEVDVKETKRLLGELLNILDERTNRTKDEWAKAIKTHDFYMTKTQAMKYGIVNKEYGTHGKK